MGIFLSRRTMRISYKLLRSAKLLFKFSPVYAPESPETETDAKKVTCRSARNIKKNIFSKEFRVHIPINDRDYE